MIYIDIDETVRDLLTPIKQKYGIEPEEWITWDTKINGKGFCSFIDREISAEAPLTKFGEELKNYISNNEMSLFKFLSGAIYKEETQYWLSKHFNIPNRARWHAIFVEKSSDKAQYIQPGDWIIDDYPGLQYFKSLVYRWICIPQLYNFGVNCYRRTDDFKEIRQIISAS